MKIDFFDKLQEECAVFGACLTTDEAVGLTYNGLLTLQHRGQESAGLVVLNEGKFTCVKDLGLVSEVFSDKIAQMPAGKIAIGHTRYSTTGESVKENAGPFVTEYLTGRIATAHNGNLTNTREIKDKLKLLGVNFDSTSDSEVISALIAYSITEESNTLAGVVKAAKMLRGAFSLAIASNEDVLIALRDPSGYRPLCIGKNAAGYAVASESCALDVCGFEFVRDVKPGEIVIAKDGKLIYESVELDGKKENGLCIFEYIYFARPDSIIDGLSVHEARRNMGAILAEEYPVDADIVCGIPDSGLEAAAGYSAKSGLPLVSGFEKNRYIGRSFIYPTQLERDIAVRLKLNPLSANVKDKRVVLVDDSMVRGTTTRLKVQNLKNAGAKEVHMRLASPPFRHVCNYGTDIDKEENLIANKMSIEEIRQAIGADSLGYISIKGLKRACAKCNLDYCTACF
ncbi:MAG: amidophosphoribosyltransferase [Defluviitaleaceae bacterium]|nr:amidophosphoribosyltransferase [Defluviitaleaceae bacterium]